MIPSLRSIFFFFLFSKRHLLEQVFVELKAVLGNVMYSKSVNCEFRIKENFSIFFLKMVFEQLEGFPWNCRIHSVLKFTN